MATPASLRAALPALALVLLATAPLASAADAGIAPPADVGAGKCDSNIDTNCEYCKSGIPSNCQHCEVYVDYDPIERGCAVNLTATELFARRVVACVMHPVWCPILTS